jgi:acetyl-CoA synthetase (ADP-forming)
VSLDYFFKPKTIAVVGASNNPLKLGYDVFKNLKGYKGRVYPVNTREEFVQGEKAYRSVTEIPDKIDLVVVIVPKQHVKKVVEDCTRKGVKGIIIITGGFGETGEKGKKEEDEVVKIARRGGSRIIGPNCVGVMDTWSGLNATFIMNAKKGDIAFISQSGALGAGIIYKTIKEEIGFSKFISIGNMADVDFGELIEYLSLDSETRSIVLYIEGLRDGRRFLRKAIRASKKKPVIVLKAGRSEGGSRAISSHTGSLAGTYRIYEAAFRQSGVIVAKTVEEMLSMARAFSQPLPRKCGVAIITNAGGPAVLASDEIEENGGFLCKLDEKTIKRLKEFLPPIASLKNPIDMVASARGEDYYKALKTVLSDDNVGIIVVVCVVPTFGGMTRKEHAEGILRALRETNARKPVIALFMAGEVSYEAKKILEEHGVPVYERPEDVGSAIRGLCFYARHMGQLDIR